MGEVVPQLTGANVAYAVRARVVLLRDLGAPLAPDNCFWNYSRFRNSPFKNETTLFKCSKSC